MTTPKNAIEVSYTWKTTSAFYDRVIPDIPGFVTGVVDLAIRDAAIAFCEKSLCWRQTLDPIGISANVDQVSLSLPQYTVIADVLDAELATGGWLEPRNLAGTQTERASVGGVPPRTGTPSGYLLFDEGYLTIDPVPVGADTLTLLVALKPARDAAKLPSFLYERWAPAIAAGAKAELMRQQKKPWSNPGLSVAQQMMFDQAISTAAMRAARSNTRMPLRARTVHRLS